jgi:hypothetical protein
MILGPPVGGRLSNAWVKPAKSCVADPLVLKLAPRNRKFQFGFITPQHRNQT